MGDAVLPFIGYILIQFFVATVGLIVVREKKHGFSGLLKCWIFGQMLLFAVLQLMAVPMIFLRWKFDALFWSYCGVCLVLFCFGCLRFKNEASIKLKISKLSPLALILLMSAALLILYQAGIYFFGVHLDEDDARWLAEANDALTYGDMMLRDFRTGEYRTKFLMIEDVSSPWPFYFAILAKILSIRVSIVAHTLYPSIGVILMYSVFWLIGQEFFIRQEAKMTFLLISSIVCLFYGGSVYTQGIFAMTRIWQGKASVAGLAIPLLFYLFVCINKRDKKTDWMLIAIVCSAACLMSGMGIFISGIMVGIYGLLYVVLNKRWVNIPLWLSSVLPSVIFLSINIFLRGRSL